MVKVTKYVSKIASVKDLPIGYFGASTGAASALVAASRIPEMIRAVVSRGGRPDMALNNLYVVECPTLLIVGELDHDVIILNQEALNKLQVTKSLQIIKGATHLFEEPGTLEEVAELSADWFEQYLIKKSFSMTSR